MFRRRPRGMSDNPWEATVAFLHAAGVKFSRGLVAKEFDRIEAFLGVSFPSDLRGFLSCGMPKGRRWPNWRRVKSKRMAGALSWPADGMCFDVRNNGFWLPEWGGRPSSDEEACEVARAACSRAPLLLPVYGHRYLPAFPCDEGYPVLSVYQTDIIYYGPNLERYFRAEFEEGWSAQGLDTIQRIPFWSDVMEQDS